MRALWLLLGLTVALVARAGEPVDFTLEDLQGRDHSLSDYRGKWVVVNYWATWCPPCLEEIPELVDFHDRHKGDDAVVLGVNFEDIGGEQLRHFVDSLLVSYPVLRTEPVPRTALGFVPGLPTTFVVDPSGTPVARQVGPVTAQMLEDYIAGREQEADAGESAP